MSINRDRRRKMWRKIDGFPPIGYRGPCRAFFLGEQGGMDMSLPERLTQDLQSAMKSKDQLRMDVIRMIKAAFQKREIELKKDLDDAEMSRIMATLVKQRRESIDMYEKGQRVDLAGRERREIAIIETYLPRALSPDELSALVDRIIREAGSPTIKDMGAIMKTTMAQLAGSPVDGKIVSDLVRSKLK